MASLPEPTAYLKALGAALVVIVVVGALSSAVNTTAPASQTAQAGAPVDAIVVSIEATDPRAQEDAGVARFTVARTGTTTEALGVDFVMSGTATRNADYTLSGPGISSTDPDDARLTIRAGATSSVMTVRGIRDTLVEGNETVIMTLVNRTVYTLGSPASATITIVDQKDFTPPTVVITAPAEGAKVGGSVVITAEASDSDAAGVDLVKFKIDGTNVDRDLKAPYRFVWESTAEPDGTYRIVAVARDVAGNRATTTRNVIVSNASPPPPQTLVPLYRYYNGLDHMALARELTAEEKLTYYHEAVQGYISPVQIDGTRALYSCRQNGHPYNHVPSLDQNCGGHIFDEIIGYVWTTPAPDRKPMYRCHRLPFGTRSDHYLRSIPCPGDEPDEDGSNAMFFVARSSPTTQGPSCELNASPSTIVRGQSSTLSWETENATSGSINWSVGAMTIPSGSTTTSPNVTRTFTATVADASGKTTRCQTTVTVEAADALFEVGDTVEATARVAVRATPSTGGTRLGVKGVGARGTIIGGPITANNYTWWNIDWTTGVDGWSVQDFLKGSTAPPQSCTLDGVTVLHGESHRFYSTRVSTPALRCIALSQVRTCTDGVLSGDSQYQYASCSVNEIPQLPSCSLTIEPNSIARGATSTLSWASSNATSITIDRGLDTMGQLKGSATISPARSLTYTATVIGQTIDDTASCTAAITVDAAAPAAFEVGDTVSPTVRVAVRATPTTSGTRLDAKGPNAQGIIVGGPTTANNFTWWKIAWPPPPGSRALVLEGWSVQNYLEAAVAPPQSCTLDGVTVLNGEFRTFYSSRTAAPPQQCATFSQSRTCTNGVLSGDSAYQYGTCEVTTPPKFQNGDRVQATQNLRVRATAGGTPLVPVQKKDAQGTIENSPPQKATVAGVEYTWYRVNWDTAPDGWSVENFMEKAPTAAAELKIEGLTYKPGDLHNVGSQIVVYSDPNKPPSHTLTAALGGKSARVGFDDKGGGYMMNFVLNGFGIPGVDGEQVAIPNYGRGWQGSSRSSMHTTSSGMYNPTQAGYTDQYGAPVEVVQSAESVLVPQFQMPLFYNGVPNVDHRIRTEYDFSAKTTNATGKYGIPAFDNVQYYAYVRPPRTLTYFGIEERNRAKDISPALPGNQAATNSDVSRNSYTPMGLRLTQQFQWIHYRMDGKWVSKSARLAGFYGIACRVKGTGLDSAGALTVLSEESDVEELQTEVSEPVAPRGKEDCGEIDLPLMILSTSQNPGQGVGVGLYLPTEDPMNKEQTRTIDSNALTEIRREDRSEGTVMTQEFRAGFFSIRSRQYLIGMFSPESAAKWHGRPSFELLTNRSVILVGTPAEILGAVQGSPTDTIKPVVSLTAPPAGNVSGAVTVSATATDTGSGVEGVTFKDGLSKILADITAPSGDVFSYLWNTLLETNGPHTLYAVARDKAGNVATSSPVSVTVENETIPPKFTNGDRVEATSNVQVRIPAGGPSQGRQLKAARGTVEGGPTKATRAGIEYTWWNINWDTAPDGWVAEDFVEKSLQVSACGVNDEAAVTSATNRQGHRHLGPRGQTREGTSSVVQAVADGNWNDSSIWSGGVPSDGATIVIPHHVNVTLGSIESARLKHIQLCGTLQFASDADTRLLVETIQVEATGSLRIGTESAPVRPNKKAEVVFIDTGTVAPTAEDPEALRRGLISYGEVKIYGTSKTPFTTAGNRVPAGASTITLDAAPTRWGIGDSLVIPATRFTSTRDGPLENEVRTITAVSGSTVTLNAPLSYEHRLDPSMQVHIANLARNVVFRSENTATDRRGHVMLMNCSASVVKHALFLDLGRTDKSRPIDDPITGGGTNPRGRYALHFHLCGIDQGTAVAEGSVAWGSPSWGMVNHTSRVNFTDNIVYNFTGAGFVTEEGAEMGTFRGNFAAGGTKNNKVPVRPMYYFEGAALSDFATFGECYFFSGPLVRVVDNVAAGCIGPGFVYLSHNIAKGPKGVIVERQYAQEALGSLSSDLYYWGSNAAHLLPSEIPVNEFDGNTAYANQMGLYVHLVQDTSAHIVTDFVGELKKKGLPNPFSTITGSASAARYTPFRIQDSKFWNNSVGVHIRRSNYGVYRNLFIGADAAPPAEQVDSSTTWLGFLRFTSGPTTIENTVFKGYPAGIVSDIRDKDSLTTSGLDFIGIPEERKIIHCDRIRQSGNTICDGDDDPPPSDKFSPGDRVQTTDRLIVRDSAGGASQGTQLKNARGTILADPPQKAKRGGIEYTWWNVDFDIAPDGWSAEDFLEKAAPVSAGELSPVLPQNRTYPFPMQAHAINNTRLGTSAYNGTMNALQPFVWIHGTPRLAEQQNISSRISGNGTTDAWGDPVPSKVLTLQDAYGGIGPDEWKYVYPGHLLYRVGSNVTSISSAPDAQGFYSLTVQNPNRISSNQDELDTFNDGKNHYFIAVYPLSGGTPDWNRAEYMKVVQRVESGGTVTFKVARSDWRQQALNLSSPNQSFAAGNAVAAVPFRFWSGQLQVNFSLDSAKVPTNYIPPGTDSYPYSFARVGEVGAEWFARLIQARVLQAGAQGVEFDVARWTWGRQNNSNFAMDADNDLVVDHGYVAGVNSFGLGARVFHETLRSLLGTNKIIQADSTASTGGVRDWKYLNGVQMESFPSANDYDIFSAAFTHLRLWSENAGKGQSGIVPLTYAYSKTATEAYNVCTIKRDYDNTGLIVPITPTGQCLQPSFLEQFKGLNSRARINLASATLVEMMNPYTALETNEYYDPDGIQETGTIRGTFDWDEYHRGVDNVWGWLGKPVGSLKRELQYTSGNLFAQTSWSLQKDAGFQATTVGSGGVLSAIVTEKADPGVVVPNESWGSVRFVPSTALALTPGKEYTITFDARGDDDWTYKGKTYQDVPRMLAVFMPMKTVRLLRAMGVLVDSSWRSYSLTFTAASCPSSSTNDRFCPPSGINTPYFGVSEQVGKTEIRNIKVYEGSGERWSREFGGGIVLLNMSNVPWNVALSGSFKRIQGMVDPVVNNGSAVGSSVTIPARDALFLVRTAAPSASATPAGDRPYAQLASTFTALESVMDDIKALIFRTFGPN